MIAKREFNPEYIYYKGQKWIRLDDRRKLRKGSYSKRTFYDCNSIHVGSKTYVREDVLYEPVNKTRTYIVYREGKHVRAEAFFYEGEWYVSQRAMMKIVYAYHVEGLEKLRFYVHGKVYYKTSELRQFLREKLISTDWIDHEIVRASKI